MTEPAHDPTDRLAEVALTAVREEYDELCDQWKALDSKAQATGAVAGILLAGLFAFVRDQATRTTTATFLLAAAIVLSLAAAFFVVRVMQIRSVDPPPLGDEITRLVDDVAAKSKNREELVARTTLFLKDQRRLWEKPISSTHEGLASKVAWLIAAQWALLLALVALAVSTLHRLFTS